VSEPSRAAGAADPDAAGRGVPRVIAIDGPAGSGKSTVARELARRLGLDYLDTGAMYRSVAFAALQRGIDPEDKEPVARLARQIAIDVGDLVRVDGYDATIEIRGPEVTRAVSTVAANPEVRAELRDRQRAWAQEHGGGVVEGRDIGTVVFPSAEIKVFLTAADDERARRRHREVTALNYDADSPGLAVESIQAEMARRDLLDASRAAGPLAVADDAVVIDTTGRSVDDIVDEVMARVRATEGSPAAVGTGAPLVRDSRGVWRPERPSRRAEAFDLGLYGLCRAAIHVFARVYWRLSIDGTANLPPAGAYVVAPVHRSNIDTPLIGCITRRRLRFLGKDSLWKNRASARFLSALGGFPVHRGTVDRDALRRCIEVVEAGEPLVLFAEGTRQSGPLVHELFEGAAYVALRTGVPIIPVGIGGSERAMPKGSKMLWPVRIAIVVGEPIEPPAAERLRGSRRAARELTAQLHKELQAMFDAAQVRAGA
jgi:cytidylate kinase